MCAEGDVTTSWSIETSHNTLYPQDHLLSPFSVCPLDINAKDKLRHPCCGWQSLHGWSLNL